MTSAQPPEDAGMRRVLGDLPPVEPPAGFLPGLVRRTRRRARGLVGSGVVVSLAVLAVGVAVESGVDEQEVSPPLADLVDQHRAVAQAGAGPVSEFEPMDEDELPAPYWAPSDLEGSFHAMGAFANEDVMQVAYTDGTVELSVFEQPGNLESSVLARRHLDRVGETGWTTSEGPVLAVVVEREGMVYTVVGDAEPTEMTVMAEQLPGSRSMGLADRFQEVADDLVDLFALG